MTGYFLREELMGFPDRLNTKYESKKEIKED